MDADSATISRAEYEGVVSLLIEVQQECIEARAMAEGRRQMMERGIKVMEASKARIEALEAENERLRASVIEECVQVTVAYMRSCGLVELPDFARGKAAGAGEIADALRRRARAAIPENKSGSETSTKAP